MAAVTLLQPALSLHSHLLFFGGTSNGGQGLGMLGKCCTLGLRRTLSGHVTNVPSVTQNPKEEVNDLRWPTEFSHSNGSIESSPSCGGLDYVLLGQRPEPQSHPRPSHCLLEWGNLEALRPKERRGSVV